MKILNQTENVHVSNVSGHTLSTVNIKTRPTLITSIIVIIFSGRLRQIFDYLIFYVTGRINVSEIIHS